MDDFNEKSRMNRFDKRRKTTRNISLFLIVGVVLLIVLLALFVFGGNEEQDTDANNADSTDESAENKAPDQSSDDSSSTDPENESEDKQSNNNSQDLSLDGEDEEVETLEPEDDNVIEAYTKHWDPVSTQQSEPHTVVYEDGSQDRAEMEKAIETATGLSREEITYLWLANNGDQKVLATFSDTTQEEHYRVYMSWIENEGWQPKKVEILQENDQKYRFE